MSTITYSLEGGGAFIAPERFATEHKEIPLPSGVPLFSFRIRLTDRDYEIALDWNGRQGRWYLSIKTIDGTRIAMGRKVSANLPILEGDQWNLLAPKGLLVPIDFSQEAGRAPGFLDLGTRVRLIYYEPPAAIPPGDLIALAP